ncbi:MAG: alginate export family protein [Candidatus Omnitrophica bacterium]|nr:alginate export family protein [Candidatus Omnitrophota bacterium]
MVKKLIILAAIFSLSLAASSFAAVENIKVSGDISAYGIHRGDFDFGLDGVAQPNDGIDVGLSAIRLQFDADLTEDVMVTLRLLNERLWGTIDTEAAGGAQDTGVDIDLAYVTLKDFLGYPVTLKVGRQEIKLGQGMIIGDPYTNSYNPYVSLAGTNAGSQLVMSGLDDFSARKAFDAIVGIIDLAPMTITVGYIKDTEAVTTSIDDTNTMFVNVGYDFDANLIGEVYVVSKNDQRKNAAKDITNVIGTRWVANPLDALTLVGEFAYQTKKGDPAGGGIRADGKHSSDIAVLVGANYAFLDIDWVPTIGVDWAYFSRNWDPMYEDLTVAHIANAIFPNMNISTIGLTLTAKPREDLMASIRYVNLRLVDEVMTGQLVNNYATYVMDDSKALGNELDLGLRYDYTEDVQLGLDMDFFFPGDAFNEVNDDTATQAVASMKVTF